MKKWFKKNKKVIFTVLILIVAISVFSSFDNTVFGKLTHEEDLLRGETGFLGAIADIIGSLVNNALNFGTGILTRTICHCIICFGCCYICNFIYNIQCNRYKRWNFKLSFS